MIYNPFRVIRELEAKLESAELARLRAEDESRLMRSQVTAARESESQARKDLIVKSERIEDWMASLLHQRPINSTVFEKQVPPEPVRRPAAHGAALEAAMMAKYEKELGIDQPN